MLVKLFKYDMKSMAKSLFPLYVILLVMSFFSKLAIKSDGFMAQLERYGSLFNILAVIRVFVFVVFVFIFGAVVIVNFIVMIKRFSSNLLGDEGYLMNTLPVKPWQNILSKLLSAFIFNILSGIAAFLAILILVYDSEAFSELLYGIHTGWYEIKDYIDINMAFVIITLMALAFIAGGFYQILVFYASAAMGHLADTHRKLMSFVAFIGINFMINIVSGVFTNIMAAFLQFNSVYIESTPEMYYQFMISVLSVSILISLVIGGILFAITNHILSKRLNLE